MGWSVNPTAGQRLVYTSCRAAETPNAEPPSHARINEVERARTGPERRRLAQASKRGDVETTRSLEASLVAQRTEAIRWRADARKLIDGLGVAIEAQFGSWGLSPAEQEVALLLLKGLSHKEVAAARGIGEPTARQQARAVYKKAGLAGRHDLAAFFLEDLLLPGSLQSSGVTHRARLKEGGKSRPEG